MYTYMHLYTCLCERARYIDGALLVGAERHTRLPPIFFY